MSFYATLMMWWLVTVGLMSLSYAAGRHSNGR